jgi:hypothetical protein
MKESKLDKLRGVLDETQVRGVSVHSWPEALDITRCSAQMSTTLTHLDLFPSKAWIYEDLFGERATKRWLSPDSVVLETFGTITAVSVDSALPLSPKNLKSRTGFFEVSAAEHAGIGKIYLEGEVKNLNLDRCIEIVSVWLSLVTPRFGFSTVGRKDSVMLLHAGQPTSSEDELCQKRIRAYEAARSCNPDDENFLGRRLLDVFEMNILSPDHMRLRVFDKTLEAWITDGNRGALFELKRDVYAWTVVGTARAAVREELLRGKYLVVPV